ncbi:MAG: LacI family DNA-binding transcriptional regulator, partial [Aquincola sp.]|nr:LacI family DNA-binding transcriptional regulator [Aquincola sp.]
MKSHSPPPVRPARARSRTATRPSKASGPVTLEMVALAAGVSPSTVSRILNGTASVAAAKQ